MISVGSREYSERPERLNNIEHKLQIAMLPITKLISVGDPDIDWLIISPRVLDSIIKLYTVLNGLSTLHHVMEGGSWFVCHRVGRVLIVYFPEVFSDKLFLEKSPVLNTWCVVEIDVNVVCNEA